MTLQSDQLNLSILEHGIMVSQYFMDLYSHLQFNNTLQYDWKLPEWLTDNKQYILDNLLPIGMLTMYQIYHDIGKPYCKIYDLSNKKPHFPDHAEKSAAIFSDLSDDELISTLIKRDMDIHLMKAKDIPAFIGTTQTEQHIGISLLLTGLAEIHANAKMFGGIDSTSFKIKYKQIDSRGKAIMKYLRGIK